MSKIAIITDTDCSLPADVSRKHGIRQVPITVHFDTQTFSTGVDIDDTLLFKKIDQLNKLPTTSAPSPGAFVNAYQEAFDGGAEEIVCICVSSKVSATYGAAVDAAGGFPGRAIRVIDSLSLCMGQGFMVLAAAEAAEAGASLEEVVAKAEEVGRRQHLYAVLATLKYLALSGRVGKLVAGMADTLNIKPILTIQDGKLDLLEKVRTRKKAIDRMLDLTGQSLDGRQIERVAIIHVTNPEGARELEALVRSQFRYTGPVITAEFSAGLSVHAGAGVVGVVVQTS